MINNPKRLIKKIGSSHIVWFGESNRWVRFEEPAYFVYKLYSGDIETAEIIARCKKKYKLLSTECNKFVKEIISGINEHSSTSSDDDLPDELKFADRLPSRPFTSRSYHINGYNIEVSFENPLLGYYIHPLFAHLETGNKKPDLKFAILDDNNKFVLHDSVTKKYLIFENINRLKRTLFTCIANGIYNRPGGGWIADIHASAVTDGKSTILFSSSSGSGKSTLAAMLVSKGFQSVSDDFVLLGQKKAYPFPAAITIKKGAFSLFPESSLMEWNYGELKNRQVKLLYPEIKDNSFYDPKPVRTIVFLKYNPFTPFKLEKLPLTNALALFYNQAFVSSEPANAKKFIDWFAGLNCYSLEYSDNEKTIKKVQQLYL